MPHPLVNAFTVAAFVFMLMGVLQASDFIVILLASVIVTKAAPTMH